MKIEAAALLETQETLTVTPPKEIDLSRRWR